MTVAPVTHFLKAYRPTDYLIDQVDLQFDLWDDHTQVTAVLSVRRNPAVITQIGALTLNGEQLELITVSLDGQLLVADVDFQLSDSGLSIPTEASQFQLAIVTRIYPDKNTELQGLYQSSGIYCTQCEAEGFRRITYFLDRPDVMARYKVRISADRARYPVLLSNGNLNKSGESGDGRHWVEWVDPYPKPSYLFAMVAGDLSSIQDRFVTASGRTVDLFVYVEAHNIDKCDFAMQSLKKAMAWDEQVYGLEYDLDRYMIVAVDDFNMGAMENKGLNIFNSKFVLASPETATDTDYMGIESVVAHEYFHNWSGNRVTCRDWFQLSLKEGFTVFRDQQFSADMNSYGVKRIEEVNILRTHQFREDAGPLAHSVRPESYVEINNFYTVTVYNKGAELVRMLHHLLGRTGFRAGTDLYFNRHDGQAVTTDDFVQAMEDANGVDLSQFRRWYSLAGTPQLSVQKSFDASRKTYTLEITQSCQATPGQDEKQPFHIPIAMGLIDRQGNAIPLRLAGASGNAGTTTVLELKQARQVFEFVDVAAEPVPSLLRDFSAPVKVTVDLDDEDYCLLIAHDRDDFNRWDAAQQLAVKLLIVMVGEIQQGRTPVVMPRFIEAMGRVVDNPEIDPALAAQILTLPSEAYLSEFFEIIDPVAIHQARLQLRQQLAGQLEVGFNQAFLRSQDHGSYAVTPLAVGRRSLKNVALGYLMETPDMQGRQLCMQQFDAADNMTDVMSALGLLSQYDCPERDQALAQFHQRWQQESLVMDKWLSIQATSRLPDTLARVKALTGHAAFKLTNPNKVRALIGAFCQGNAVRFHAQNGEGYQFLGRYVAQLNEVNPQIAARLVTPLVQWRKYDPARQSLMRTELEAILAIPDVARDVYEVASKALAV